MCWEIERGTNKGEAGEREQSYCKCTNITMDGFTIGAFMQDTRETLERPRDSNQFFSPRLLWLGMDGEEQRLSTSGIGRPPVWPLL